MSETNQNSASSGSEYQDFPFQDHLADRKAHYKSGLNLGRIKHKQSGAVKFRVKDILDLIADKKLAQNPNARLVFHFAAYKPGDYQQYMKKPGAKETGITQEDFNHRPTLILAYENSPVSAECFDVGLICPPPPDCLA